MIRLLRRWFWRTVTHALHPCPSCTGALSLCGACHGNWQIGCPSCRLGQVCSSCHTYWI